MTLVTQLAWQIGYRRGVRELAELRAATLRSVAVAACLADGTGIHALRAGAYTAADLLLLRDAVAVNVPAARTRRMHELESDLLPLSREDIASAVGIFGGTKGK